MWLLMQLNKSARTINTTLQLLDIYIYIYRQTSVQPHAYARVQLKKITIIQFKLYNFFRKYSNYTQYYLTFFLNYIFLKYVMTSHYNYIYIYIYLFIYLFIYIYNLEFNQFQTFQFAPNNSLATKIKNLDKLAKYQTPIEIQFRI